VIALELEKYRNLLLARQLELQVLEDICKDARAPVVLEQSSVGRLSRMDALQGQSMAQETFRRREQELLQIKSALARIENDNYGFCLHCDEEIAFKRLEFNPAVTACIKCAE